MLLKLNDLQLNNKNPAQSFYMLFDGVSNSTSKEICEWIMQANLESEGKPDVLNLVINSPGGSVTDAFAVIDVMRGSHIPVRTIGLGEISSAALMIFISGTKGMRVLTENTSIMSHIYSWGSAGKEHELLAAIKEFDLISQRIVEHYKRCTKLKSEKDIRKYLLPKQDVFLSSEEAMRFGLCDKISKLS
jgi:ATP-dependent Clp protease protease subunit